MQELLGRGHVQSTWAPPRGEKLVKWGAMWIVINMTNTLVMNLT